MRIIKFRGKSVATGNWVYGDLYSRGAVSIYANGERLSVEEDTVGQFTGLKNEEGVDLYEGDIIEMDLIDPIFGDLVKITDGNYIKAPIIFKDGAFVVRYSESNTIYLDAIVRLCHCKVAGNIYDNADIITYPAKN